MTRSKFLVAYTILQVACICFASNLPQQLSKPVVSTVQHIRVPVSAKDVPLSSGISSLEQPDIPKLAKSATYPEAQNQNIDIVSRRSYYNNDAPRYDNSRRVSRREHRRRQWRARRARRARRRRYRRAQRSALRARRVERTRRRNKQKARMYHLPSKFGKPASCHCFINWGAPRGACYKYTNMRKGLCKKRDCSPSYECINRRTGVTCMLYKKNMKIVPTGYGKCKTKSIRSYTYIPYNA